MLSEAKKSRLYLSFPAGGQKASLLIHTDDGSIGGGYGKKLAAALAESMTEPSIPARSFATGGARALNFSRIKLPSSPSFDPTTDQLAPVDTVACDNRTRSQAVSMIRHLERLPLGYSGQFASEVALSTIAKLLCIPAEVQSIAAGLGTFKER